ncbi:MAG: DUF1592 domain-containing protein [Pseudomonadota bacterium]
MSNPPGGVGAGNATSASGGAANPGAGSGGAVTGTGGAGPGPGASACVPGVPATTQIPRLLNRQYDAVMRDLLGVTAVAANGNQPPSSLLTIDFDGAMNADAWRLYRTAADTIAKEVMSGPNRSKFIACNPADAGCLSETIRAFGRKAFRRPLTDMEVARFEKLGQTTPPGTPEEVAEATLAAFLSSPSFLLIPELSTQTEGSAIKLSSHEMAARLSFMIWGSIPDEELNAAADADMLQTPDQILAQAQRMLAVSEKVAPVLSNFHRVVWAGDDNTPNSHWWKISHDDHPLYNEAAKVTYREELERFFEEVAFNGSFAEFFLSPVAYVNRDTAAIYGLDPAGFGPELTRVELDKQTRPGFMTRIGFLSSFAHEKATSPILRGVFVTVNIAGVNVPPPPPGAAEKPAPPGEYKTEREYVDSLTSQSDDCKGCHILGGLNQPGYVLENYDVMGKWQDVDPRGGPINPVAEVKFDGTPRLVNNAYEMMQIVASLPAAKAKYAEKFVSFAYRRDPNVNDACVVEQIAANLAQENYRIVNILADLTQANSFRLRVATP